MGTVTTDSYTDSPGPVRRIAGQCGGEAGN